MSLPASPKRILITRLSALGDVVHTLPVLATLRHTFPDAQIGWLTETSCAPLIAGHPDIDHVHVCHRKTWLKQLTQPSRWGTVYDEAQAFIQSIRAVNYDVMIDTQGLLKSALWGFLAGIPNRLGLANAREGAVWLYTHRIKPQGALFNPDIWVTDHYWPLLDALGCTQWTINYPLPPTASVPLNSHISLPWQVQNAKIVLAPATLWESKHWPLRHWQTLIQQLLEQTSATLVIIGAPNDAPLANALLTNLPVTDRLVNLTGQTNLQDLRWVIENATVVIAADSGPLHLAGAVNTHVIGLYGPTSTKRTPPPGKHSTVLSLDPILSCQPCHQKQCPIITHDCLNQLAPETVLSHVLNTMATVV